MLGEFQHGVCMSREQSQYHYILQRSLPKVAHLAHAPSICCMVVVAVSELCKVVEPLTFVMVVPAIYDLGIWLQG